MSASRRQIDYDTSMGHAYNNQNMNTGSWKYSIHKSYLEGIPQVCLAINILIEFW